MSLIITKNKILKIDKQIYIKIFDLITWIIYPNKFIKKIY
jgi:hypothetical protein